MIKRPVQEMLDGFAVESYSGKVTGSFDVTNDTGRALAYGDEVLLVIQASVKPPAYKTDSNGDLQRVEVFAPNEAEIIIDGETWGKIEDITGVLGTGGQHRLFNPRSDEDPHYTVDVDRGTGEIRLASNDDVNLDEDLGEQVMSKEEAADHAAARERARVAAADSMDDDVFVPGGSAVERIDGGPAGSQDPVLRRFLEDTRSG